MYITSPEINPDPPFPGSDQTDIYISFINKRGLPILFIHPILSDSDIFNETVKELPYSSIVMDMRGHGRTVSNSGIHWSRIYAHDIKNVVEYFGELFIYVHTTGLLYLKDYIYFCYDHFCRYVKGVVIFNGIAGPEDININLNIFKDKKLLRDSRELSKWREIQTPTLFIGETINLKKIFKNSSFKNLEELVRATEYKNNASFHGK